MTAPQDYHVHTTFSDGESTPLSVARVCAAAGCAEVAITDHVDQDGNFAFVPEFRGRDNLRSYIDAIGRISEHALTKLGVSVHAGIEFCTTSHEYKASFRDHVAPFCDELDIVLIEGRDDAGPVEVAIAIREVLHDLGMKGMPVVISHPEFSMLVEKVDLIVRHNIGLELNEAKLSPAHKNGLDLVLATVHEQGLTMPRFTLGSDAHAATDAGKIPLVHQHARVKGLLDHLIWL
ncbi:MAG: PHP domain-containing protein [Candidatus Sigynarchaeota archaeon]